MPLKGHTQHCLPFPEAHRSGLEPWMVTIALTLSDPAVPSIQLCSVLVTSLPFHSPKVSVEGSIWSPQEPLTCEVKGS